MRAQRCQLLLQRPHGLDAGAYAGKMVVDQVIDVGKIPRRGVDKGQQLLVPVFITVIGAASMRASDIGKRLVNTG